MVPVAPALLSTTKVCLKVAVSEGPMARAIESVEPPGGKGTTSVTGLSGQAWAGATSATASAASANRCFMGVSGIGSGCSGIAVCCMSSYN